LTGGQAADAAGEEAADSQAKKQDDKMLQQGTSGRGLAVRAVN